MKHAGGRPTKYRPEYVQKMLDFFSIDPTREVEIKFVGKDGNPWSKFEERPNRLPTFEIFAFNLNVSVDTLIEWSNALKVNGRLKYPEFSEAYKRCKQLQKNFLIQNGTSGLFNAPFTIFVAKNITDMKDKTEQDIMSGGKPISPLLGGDTRVHTDNSNREDTPTS